MVAFVFNDSIFARRDEDVSRRDAEGFSNHLCQSVAFVFKQTSFLPHFPNKTTLYVYCGCSHLSLILASLVLDCQRMHFSEALRAFCQISTSWRYVSLSPIRRRGRRFTFFPFKGGFEFLHDGTFANVVHRLGVSMKPLNGLLIGQWGVFDLIDGEQDVSMFDFCGITLAGRNDFDEFLPFVRRQCCLVCFIYFAYTQLSVPNNGPRKITSFQIPGHLNFAIIGGVG